MLLGLLIAFFVLRDFTFLFLVSGAHGGAEGVRLTLTGEILLFFVAFPTSPGTRHLVFSIFKIFGIGINAQPLVEKYPTF